MKMSSFLKRVLAAGLCLCMCAGLVVETSLPALAASGGGRTTISVSHFYLGDLSLSDTGWVSETGAYLNETKSDSAEESLSYYVPETDDGSTEGVVYIYPKAQEYTSEAGAAVVEDYTGFEIIEGNDAVMWVKPTGDGQAANAGHFEIRYKADVPKVELYLFYSLDGKTMLGANFGGELAGVPGVTADQDVLKVTDQAMVNAIKGAVSDDNPLNQVQVGDIIYNTAAGLHTDKRVSADVLGDGRTFDVTLESWYSAGSNKADVGFILDSSGSMAFIPPAPDTAGDESTKPEFMLPITANDEKMYMSRGGEYASIPWDRLLEVEGNNALMTTGNTDNSPLAYSGYSYYVYDMRSSVNELAPLAFWDGTMDGAENPLKTGLVGLYQFDRTKDSAGKEPNFYKNGASSDGEATKGVTNHNTTSSDYKQDNNSGESVTPTAGAVQAYVYDKNDKYCHSTLDLDATVSDPKNFTLSFAVKVSKASIDDKNKTPWEINNSKPYTDNGPRAQDLVTIKNEDGNELYTILRGTKSKGGSQNHVRWQKAAATGDSTAYVNLDSQLTSSYDGKWRVFTYVVKEGVITAYVDGEPAGVSEALDLGTGPLHFTLGGDDEFASGPNLQIDEVYIYNRALDDDKVSGVAALVNTMKEATGSVLKSEDQKYANVNGTTMSLYSHSDFSGLNTEDRAGWYYVNSTSNIDDITATGSAKSLHGLTSGTYPADMGDKDGNLYTPNEWE